MRLPLAGIFEAVEGLRRVRAFLDGFEVDSPHPEVIRQIKKDLGHLTHFAESLGLAATKDRCEQFKIGLPFRREDRGPKASEISKEIEQLLLSLDKELGSISAVYVEKGHEGYFDQDHLMGRTVTDAFPSATGDIRDAGNSLALGLNTAAVFHLMAVINAGIIALSRHLKTGFKNPELHDWKPLISALGAKLEKIHKKPRSIRKKDELEFYAGLLGELSALKDVHRNNVSHAKRRYNEQEALGVFLRVKDFMQRLAVRVKE